QAGELKSYQRKHKLIEEHRKEVVGTEMGNGHSNVLPLLPSSTDMPPDVDPHLGKTPAGVQQEKKKKLHMDSTLKARRLPNQLHMQKTGQQLAIA
ncbi:hypothetical protein KI387_029446, partial [Taxus chinensis]